MMNIALQQQQQPKRGGGDEEEEEEEEGLYTFLKRSSAGKCTHGETIGTVPSGDCRSGRHCECDRGSVTSQVRHPLTCLQPLTWAGETAKSSAHLNERSQVK